MHWYVLTVPGLSVKYLLVRANKSCHGDVLTHGIRWAAVQWHHSDCGEGRNV